MTLKHINSTTQRNFTYKTSCSNSSAEGTNEIFLYLSPSLDLLNWSAMMHTNVGPILAPFNGVSAKPPTNKSTLSANNDYRIYLLKIYII